MRTKAIEKSGISAIAPSAIASSALATVMLTLLTFTLVSCGPMNPKPADSTATPLKGCEDELAQSPGMTPAGLATGFSLKRTFVVQARVKDPSGPGFLAHPQIGEVQYVIRLVHVEDLKAASKDALVSVQFSRTKSKTHTKYDAKVVRQDDGSFLATLVFKKAGSWNLEVHVTDGDKKDDHVFTTEF